MIYWILSIILFFNVSCELLDNSVNGTFAGEEPPVSPSPPPATPNLNDLDFSAKISINGLVAEIDKLNNRILFRGVPGGRFISLYFEHQGQPATSMLCSGLGNIAISENATFTIETPLYSSSKMVSFPCVYKNTNITLELEIEASSLAIVTSSSLVGPNSGFAFSSSEISDDGNYLAFVIEGYTVSGKSAVWRKNLNDGSIVSLSIIDSTGIKETYDRSPSLSSDGRWFVFQSNSTDLVTGASGYQVYLKDMDASATAPVVISSIDSTQADQSALLGDSGSGSPRISSDGQSVVFVSAASNLVVGGGGNQIYLKDRANLASRPVLLSSKDPSGANQTTLRGNNTSTAPQISGDGKWVTFASTATNLVNGGTGSQIYRMDLSDLTKPPVLVSSTDSSDVDQSLVMGNSYHGDPQISDDGRWIVFRSNSTNFVNGGSGYQIYLKDMNDLAGSPILVSSADTNQSNQATYRANTSCDSPQISGDGNLVFFRSSASNFVTGSLIGGSQIYVKDMSLPTVAPLLVSSADSTASNQQNLAGNGSHSNPKVSSNGRWVVFFSESTNFVAGGSGLQIYLKDWNSPSIPPKLVSSTPNLPIRQPAHMGDKTSNNPEISANGRWAVFESSSGNLVLGARGPQIFLKDLDKPADLPILVSSLDSTQVEQTNFRANNNSYLPEVSPDGRWVVFDSFASNLVAGSNGHQVYIKDMQSPQNPPLVISSKDSTQPNQNIYQGNATSDYAQISGNGKFIVFRSAATNLVTGGNGVQIYRKDLDNLSSAPILVSSNDSSNSNQSGEKGDGSSARPQISFDGRWVVFGSTSTNFVTGVTGYQVYRKDMSNLTSSPTLLSSKDASGANQTTLQANNFSGIAAITPDGRWVVYESVSSNLILGASGGQIYLMDTENLSSPPVLISSTDSSKLDQSTYRGDSSSGAPQISDDGRWIVFDSYSTNFVTGASGYQIYVKDRNNLSDPPVLLSSLDSTQSDQSNYSGNDSSLTPSISADGQRIIFKSSSSNLVHGLSSTQILLKHYVTAP